MAVLRAQIQFEHVSGMARDRVVNTLHFNATAASTAVQGIFDAVNRFYTVPAVGTDPQTSPSAYFATTIVGGRIKIYDVTQEPAGAPLLDQAMSSLQARLTQQNLPAEVAVCMSFEGAPTTGLVQSRRRGRIYIGPLNEFARGQGADLIARPISGLSTTLRTNAQRLAQEVDPFAEWVVYSRPFAGRPYTERPGKSPLPALPARAGTTVDINRVWVDDAFDTQRRRGERPTTRGVTLTTQ